MSTRAHLTCIFEPEITEKRGKPHIIAIVVCVKLIISMVHDHILLLELLHFDFNMSFKTALIMVLNKMNL